MIRMRKALRGSHRHCQCPSTLQAGGGPAGAQDRRGQHQGGSGSRMSEVWGWRSEGPPKPRGLETSGVPSSCAGLGPCSGAGLGWPGNAYMDIFQPRQAAQVSGWPHAARLGGRIQGRGPRWLLGTPGQEASGLREGAGKPPGLPQAGQRGCCPWGTSPRALRCCLQ